MSSPEFDNLATAQSSESASRIAADAELSRRIDAISKKQKRGGGVSFLGLLTVVFITLKLGGVIGWSWWWVLAPLWMPVVIPLALIAAVGIIYFLVKELSS